MGINKTHKTYMTNMTNMTNEEPLIPKHGGYRNLLSMT